jgi:hypothetical protein
VQPLFSFRVGGLSRLPPGSRSRGRASLITSRLPSFPACVLGRNDSTSEGVGTGLGNRLIGTRKHEVRDFSDQRRPVLNVTPCHRIVQHLPDHC